MKELHYYVALDGEQQKILLRSLYDEKNALIEQGRSTDGVDELILIIGRAPVKKYKVIERGDRVYDAR